MWSLNAKVRVRDRKRTPIDFFLWERTICIESLILQPRKSKTLSTEFNPKLVETFKLSKLVPKNPKSHFRFKSLGARQRFNASRTYSTQPWGYAKLQQQKCFITENCTNARSRNILIAMRIIFPVSILHSTSIVRFWKLRLPTRRAAGPCQWSKCQWSCARLVL